MKVLLVDDDSTLADVTAFALRRAGFLVVTAESGEEALSTWEAERPDLIILDIQLPGIDGLSICRQVRAQSDVPIIMLTIRSSDDDIVQGLELGADDYMPKPFSPKQLIARARAVLRRRSLLPASPQVAAGPLVLDTVLQTVQTPGGPVRLTPLEFRLLHYLMVNRGQVLPTDAILVHVWGYSDHADRALLKQLVYRLRQKIETAAGGQQAIETVPGIGYRLGLPAAPPEPAPL